MSVLSGRLKWEYKVLNCIEICWLLSDAGEKYQFICYLNRNYLPLSHLVISTERNCENITILILVPKLCCPITWPPVLLTLNLTSQFSFEMEKKTTVFSTLVNKMVIAAPLLSILGYLCSKNMEFCKLP